MSSPNLARSARKLEDLPSDGGRTVDTLAGAMLRLFVRLNAVERRLAALEEPSAPGSARKPSNGHAETRT